MKKAITILAILFLPAAVSAAAGRYAWSNNLGWINFAPNSSSVSISDTGTVSGYAWSSNYGWVNLSPASGGIRADGRGKLSGDAWGGNVGWINFSGVSIDCSGVFHGRALGTIAGEISFDCSHCNVSTDWRPSSCLVPSPSPQLSPISTPPPSTPLPAQTASLGQQTVPSQPNQVPLTISMVLEKLKTISRILAHSAGAKVVSGVGIVAGGFGFTATVIFSSLSPSDVWLSMVRFWGILLTVLGIRKKAVPWGTVYDSVTKQPLDPAYVSLKDTSGKEVASAITDIDGRYGFLASPGEYVIEARKTHYQFPAVKLSHHVQDEMYNNLYFGDRITVTGHGETIARNIPMDAVSFDWNEFAKRQEHSMKFYSRRSVLLAKLYNLFFVIGFIVAVFALFFSPEPYNVIIFLAYLVLLGLRLLVFKPRSFGYVEEQANGKPLPFAVLRVFSEVSQREISRKVCDRYGRYYCLLPKGHYRVQVERKQADGSYAFAYASGSIDATRKGIIKETFKV